uniref:Single-stranded DNA binding protein n=1 Tax=Discostella guiyangensis TaxID=3145224 RepID=A0AB74TGS1_9STRA
MNYVTFSVKVIKNSGQSFFPDGTSLTELIVQLPQVRKNNRKVILQLSIWGKLSYDAAKYYQPDDYIIIEGYISIRNINLDHIANRLNKQVEISVFKLYPLFLKSQQFI